MTINERKKAMLEKDRFDIHDLMEIVAILRSEEGCPWDREQTHESIRNDLIEETYEVIEAIDTSNASLMREELGDLLFQIIFHARIAEEQNNFVLSDIITEISQKMIHRHPHVFGSVTVSGTGEVLSNWENIKTEEKQRISKKDKLQAIPPMLPSLMRAQKVAKKSGKFEDVTKDELIAQMEKELASLRREGSSDDTSTSLGRLLMTASALAYKKGVPAEECLFEEVNRFIDAF